MTKNKWLTNTNSKIDRLIKRRAFVNSISLKKPKSILLLTSEGEIYLVEPLALNHLSIRCNVLATNDTAWTHEWDGKWTKGRYTFSYDIITEYKHIPITDLPLYIGYHFTSSRFSQLIKGYA